MPISEKYTQWQDEENAKIPGNAEPNELKGPTVKEILAHPEQSALFGTYLESEGDQELAKKIHEGDLTAADFAALAEKRQEYLSILERSKKIVNALDARTLAQFAASSPELKTIMASVGPEGIKGAFAKHLPEIAITDRDRFAVIEDALGAIAESKKTIADRDKAMEEWCRENGVSENEYLLMLQNGNEGTKDVVDAMRSQYGWWKKLTTRKSTQVREVFYDSLDTVRGIEKDREELSQNMERMGSLLHLAMMDNAAVKEALLADLRKDTVERKEPDMSFTEMKEGIKTVPVDTDELRDAYEVFQKADENKDLDEEDMLRKFSRAYTGDRMKKKKKGFWATIFQDVYASRIENSFKPRQ